MIYEIVNYINFLEKDMPDIFEGISKKGLHILIDLKDNDEYDIQFTYIRENEEENDLIKSLKFQEEKSKVIDTHKCIASKKIFSINPYTFYFKLFATANESDKEEIKEIKNKAIEDFKSENFKKYIKKIFEEKVNFILEKSEDYFTQIINDYYDKNKDNNKINEIKKIKNFCKEKIKKILFEKAEIVPNLYLVDNKFNANLLDAIIWINFKVDEVILIDASNRYFRKKSFVKEVYTIEINNDVYGLSSFYNGDNEKKVFLKHKTALFDVNNLIKYDNLANLQKFETLVKNKKLPNPLPIFIDKEELNSRVIKIYNSDTKKLKYSEIVKQLLEKEKIPDLNNYYLFYFFNNNIVDFDYVSCFRYNISDMKIYDFFGINNNHEIEIKNIFDFEAIVIGKIFNNSLVVHSKQGDYYTRYFEDIQTKFVRSAILNNIYKYRKSIYDYIYKSKTEMINAQIFNDIILTSILDDIKIDEYKNNMHSKGYSIKEKLNIYLSINHHFDKANKNFGGFYMPNKLPELLEKINAIANDETKNLESDEEFAFAAGQIIYFLLDQSETANKTHALLEPFIQKTDVNLFKEAIIKTINKYKHNIEWYGKGKGRFELLTAQVLAYIPTKKMSELMPFILTGYFAKSIIYEKTKEEDVKDE